MGKQGSPNKLVGNVLMDVVRHPVKLLVVVGAAALAIGGSEHGHVTSGRHHVAGRHAAGGPHPRSVPSGRQGIPSPSPSSSLSPVEPFPVGQTFHSSDQTSTDIGFGKKLSLLYISHLGKGYELDGGPLAGSEALTYSGKDHEWHVEVGNLACSFAIGQDATTGFCVVSK
jgi:hypothetical protein